MIRSRLWPVASVVGIAGLVVLLLAGRAAAQEAMPKAPWSRIAPAFQPPKEFADDLGRYRSPLLFDDGRPVKTPDDWARRREEILGYWHAMLGPWPPLIAEPSIEVVQTEARENFRQERVRVQAASELLLDGYLLVPEGAQRRPAVLVVFYEPETGAGLNDKRLLAFARDLTRRGFATLSIGWPGSYTAAESVRLQPLSCLAYIAANCHTALASRPEVDPARIGIVGHSFGGKWAMFAACLYDKFACAAWSDPGIVFDEGRPNVNYWEPWYLGWEPGATRTPGVPGDANPRTGPYRRLIEAGRDLHELHALMAPRLRGPARAMEGAESHHRGESAPGPAGSGRDDQPPGSHADRSVE